MEQGSPQNWMRVGNADDAAAVVLMRLGWLWMSPMHSCCYPDDADAADMSRES